MKFYKRLGSKFKFSLICVSLLSVLHSCKKDSVTIKDHKPGVYIPKFPNSSQELPASPLNGAQKELAKQQIKSYYDKTWEGGNISGQFLVASGDEVLFSAFRGIAGTNPELPMQETTPLHIASISKSLTAVMVLKCVSDGKLKLDQTLQSIFPKFPFPQITIQDLLSHRSGLPRYEYLIPDLVKKKKLIPKNSYSNQDVLEIISTYNKEISVLAGKRFSYANTNFALLALVLEKITGVPFPELMHESLFQPLGMNNTYVLELKNLNKATPSFYANSRQHPWNEYEGIYGDKNVYTTAKDLYKFSLALFDPKWINPSLLSEAMTGKSTEKAGIKNYGYGFRLKEYPDGSKIVFHTGWWHGSNTLFIHQPKTKTTIIAIGNKYSHSIYSAMSLVSIFENFPDKKEELNKILIGGTPADTLSHSE